MEANIITNEEGSIIEFNNTLYEITNVKGKLVLQEYSEFAIPKWLWEKVKEVNEVITIKIMTPSRKDNS